MDTIYIAELYLEREKAWVVLSYHKSFSGAVKAFGPHMKTSSFPPIAKHHECFGSLEGGWRIWITDLED